MRILHRHDVSPTQWTDFVDNHSFGWFYHLPQWLNYCLAYNAEANDLSFAIECKGEIRALVPLVREGAAFTMGGHPGAEPLYLLDHRTQTEPAVHAHVAQLASQLGVRRWRTRSIPHATVPPDASTWGTWVLDLSPTEASLWTGLRRSYKSLIHRGQRRYCLQTFATPLGVQLAHAVHRDAAGRETRPQRTWELMEEWATDGHVLTALAVNESLPPPNVRGMALAIRYKDAAYYASGAGIDRDVSHALVWELIRTLRSGGINTFELGWACRPGDTEKDRNIAFFKAGFGGRLQSLLVREVSYGSPDA